MTVAPKSPLLSRSPSTNNPFPISPQSLGHQSGTSMTLPKVRTPLTPRDSIQLVKKHYSQPQPSLDRLHQLNVNIDIMTPSSASSTLKSTGTTASPFSQFVEETDIDDGLLDCMDGVVEGTESEEPSQDGVSFVGLAEEPEQLDPEVVKPPTPPLHRFPSWISSVPLPDDDSSSEDDSSSLASLRTSILSPERKSSVPGSPRAVKRGVSMSSISSESDYAIPPDAYSLDSDYSEPEHKVQRTSSYSCESSGPLVTEKKTFYLTADSPNILEEWIRVLQNILKVQASSPIAVETRAKPTVRGWLTKLPLGLLQMREASVQEVDRSCDSDEDYEAGDRGFLSSHCTLVVQPKDQSPTYLLIGTKQEKDAWLYHLTVAAGSSATLKVGTEYEQLIGKLMDVEGDPERRTGSETFPVGDSVHPAEESLPSFTAFQKTSFIITMLPFCVPRLRFRSQVKGETERERLLLVYQVNDEVQQGLFPVNKELALEVAALIAQVWKMIYWC
ncbi:hypothetical protein XENOCAPTIV_027977 [Xenoophorus captivus]|uniref:PH domain-containing protein n=1 Tax=Xenoophorus captivus TaxID=1517983 RepID=A0ABV0QWY8_9TELE